MYNFEALKATVPEALALVSNGSIRGFYRLTLRAIDAYSAGVQFEVLLAQACIGRAYFLKDAQNLVEALLNRASVSFSAFLVC